MRRVVTAVVMLISSSAHADWHYRTGHEEACGDGVIVGRCGAYGAGWHPPMLRLELGPVLHRTSIGPMVGTEEDGTPSGQLLTGGELDSRGLGVRISSGYRGYYLPIDIGVTAVDGPPVHPVGDPAVAAAVVDRGSSSGWIVTMRMGLGKELRFGRLMVGGELSFGLGVVTLGDLEREHVHDPRFLLDARAHAGVWLTPHVSLLGYASASLVREDERTFGLAVGFSLFPWDGVR